MTKVKWDADGIETWEDNTSLMPVPGKASDRFYLGDRVMILGEPLSPAGTFRGTYGGSDPNLKGKVKVDWDDEDVWTYEDPDRLYKVPIEPNTLDPLFAPPATTRGYDEIVSDLVERGELPPIALTRGKTSTLSDLMKVAIDEDRELIVRRASEPDSSSTVLSPRAVFLFITTEKMAATDWYEVEV